MLDLLDKKLACNWRKCHKWVSVQLVFLTGLMQVLYDLTPIIQKVLTENQFRYFTIIMLVFTIKAQVEKKPSGGK